MTLYRKTIQYTIVVEHDGDDDFNKVLDYHVGQLVKTNAFSSVHNDLCAAIAEIVRKDTPADGFSIAKFGLSLKQIFDKIKKWGLEQ